LRLGRVVGEIGRERLAGMSEPEATEEVIRLMFGPTAKDDGDAGVLAHEGEHRRRSVDRRQPPLLRVSGLSTPPRAGEKTLDAVTFDVWPGEIFGIAGVDGNGQTELAQVLSGQRPAAAGTILLGEEDIAGLGVAERRHRGLRYITDERLGEGTLSGHSVAINLVMKQIGEPPFWWHGLTRGERIRQHGRELIEKHDIRTPSEQTPIEHLSGGNIQKVLLARELSAEARVVIFNKPTYGLDLHNIRLARERIRAGAEAGLATIVISTELDELLELSDRIGVMYQGALRGVVDNANGPERRIGLLMTGADAA
jgi:simple sugar transport system ATP-binding protein